MNKYKHSSKDATKLSKHGIDLIIYEEGVKTASVVRVSVKEGHFQEFYDVESTFIYSIIEGKGTFFLNGEKIKVESGDQIVIPPKTKIYYFGTMKMVLTVTPPFKEENERHVRFVDKSENPYLKNS